MLNMMFYKANVIVKYSIYSMFYRGIFTIKYKYSTATSFQAQYFKLKETLPRSLAQVPPVGLLGFLAMK
jgi:hypothetical protein